MKKPLKYDVIILGGGPAGLATAVALRQMADVRVLVAEAGNPCDRKIGESAPPDILMLLAKLGLAERFKDGPHTHCPGFASMWGSRRVGYNDFITNPLGPSWRLDRPAFDTLLADAARGGGADLLYQTRFVKGEKTAAGYRVSLSGSDHKLLTAEARYVVDATGAKARFATTVAGSIRFNEDVLYAYVQFSPLLSGKMTRQVMLEAVPYGWWYAALLPDDQVVTMLVAELEQIRRLRNDGPDLYQRLMQQTEHVGQVLKGTVTGEPDICTWPVYSGMLDTVQGSDWIAVGDAAASYDPIAAQGIYKALSHGIAAGREIAAAFGSGQTSEPEKYTRYVKNAYEMYCRNRMQHYLTGNIWAGASFWKNRLINHYAEV